MVRNKILIIDDEPGARFGIRDYLETSGYEVDEAPTCQAAQELFNSRRYDAAIVDYMLPDGNALELLPRMKEMSPHTPVIVLTGYGSIDLAVQAVKLGAEQFLTKPVELPALMIVLQRLLENERNRQKQMARRPRHSRLVADPFVGDSPAVRQLAEQAQKLLATERPVLLLGETGSGKGVLAQWLHNHSPRAEEAFVDINCGGLARELLETELFGHEKGAFTGAIASKPGLLEVAHRGTVFLDEIGDMDLLVQPKLLKALEEQRFRRLGDIRDRLVDVRFIAATYQDIKQLVQEKKFREDLYFRISTLLLNVPPLRERADDISLLARNILRDFADELGRDEVDLTPDAEQALRAYQWPGNIRELRNVLERAVLLGDRCPIERRHLYFSETSVERPSEADLNLTLEELERRHIERVLRREQGNVEQAAKNLGIPRSSLYQKIKRYGLKVSRV